METRQGTLYHLVTAFAEAADLVSPLLADHHKRTAWFAVHIARGMGLPEVDQRHILIASLLHDLGAFSLQERLDTLQFEIEKPTDHARLGAALLSGFEPLKEEARLILDHHAEWAAAGGQAEAGEVPVGSRVIHLADRTAVLLTAGSEPAAQAKSIIRKVGSHSGTLFMPRAVEALRDLAGDAGLWSGAVSPDLSVCLALCGDSPSPPLGPEGLLGLAAVFSRIIDYRSHFTATHSAGVAAVAEALARRLGFSGDLLQTIRAAGFLHDLGKLAVPVEIIEKPASLTSAEYGIVQGHAEHTRRLLERVGELGYGIKWAYQHHERLDGSGYPEHAHGGEIAFGSRVVAAADVMTAITETRPYRAGMRKEDAKAVLDRLVQGGRLDPEVGAAAVGHFDRIDAMRHWAQTATWDGYVRCLGPPALCPARGAEGGEARVS